MYLDESILQSRTTLSLVSYIDKLMWTILENGHLTESMKRDYESIKTQANKASKKRSFK